MTRVTFLVLALVCAGLLAFAPACGDDDDGGGDAGTDTDTDTDSGTDTDTDSDTDTDTDTDTDGDTDACSQDTDDDADGFVDVSEDVDSYTAGEKFADQAGAPWTTWTHTPNGNLDPDVSDAQALSGANSINILEDDDLVLDLGTLASGAYQIDFQIYVPTDMIGYFNILQRFWADDETSGDPQEMNFWGVEVYFDAGGNGVVRADGGDESFSFTPDAWNAVSAEIDLDAVTATITVEDTEVFTWDWNVGTTGEADCPHLGGVNIYGPPTDSAGDAGEANFFVDDISVVQL